VGDSSGISGRCVWSIYLMGRQVLMASHDEMIRSVSLEMASPCKDDIYERRRKS